MINSQICLEKIFLFNFTSFLKWLTKKSRREKFFRHPLSSYKWVLKLNYLKVQKAGLHASYDKSRTINKATKSVGGFLSQEKARTPDLFDQRKRVNLQNQFKCIEGCQVSLFSFLPFHSMLKPKGTWKDHLGPLILQKRKLRPRGREWLAHFQEADGSRAPSLALSHYPITDEWSSMQPSTTAQCHLKASVWGRYILIKTVGKLW